MDEIKVNMGNLTDEQQKQLMKLIETANNPQTQKLAEGDEYYFLNTFNKIEKYAYYNTEIDNILFKNRNVFLTREEAEFQAEKHKVIMELQNYADKYNKHTIDWSNFIQPKWRFHYNYDCEEFITDYEFDCRAQSSVYFTSAKLTTDAINFVGQDRIKKYLFEVM